MANVAHPGFAPMKKGGATVALVRKLVLSNNTTLIAKGDALDAGTGGDVFVTATNNAAFYSVQWGGASFVLNSERVERISLPAATTYTGTAVNNTLASFVYCVEDMQATRFRASVDLAILLTDLNNNYNMNLNATTSSYSQHELASASHGTTATLPWRVLDFIVGDPKVDPTAAHAHVVCAQNAGRREPAIAIGGQLGT